MPRTHLLLPASLLMACDPAALDNGAAARPAAAEALPAGASPTWLETAKTRIAASARSIVPDDGAFVAAVPAHRAVARFTDEGLALGELGAAEPLALRFTAWGAAGAERAVEPVSPALGDCMTELLPEGDCARQLEYTHEGVTAWWLGLDRGVEFGWTVAAPPAEGDGELVFAVEVSGADWLEAVGDGAELVDASGETWRVSGALAWGADGAPLPAWLEVDGDALVVRVAAAGAVYPVTVDPVLEVATSVLEVDTADGVVSSVAGAGDVNGDGYDDVIVGSRDYGASRRHGGAFVYHGSPTGVSSTASATLADTGAAGFGTAVSGAGDVNGDGYADVVVGDPDHSGGEGRVYVYHGSSVGVSTSPSVVILGGWAHDGLGDTVSAAGDVNGDGYDDVIVGGFDTAYVHHGSSSGVSAVASRPLTGLAAYGGYSVIVADVGDVNDDGFDDVAYSVRTASYGDTGEGVVYLHLGSSSGVSLSASFIKAGIESGERVRSVSAAGDVDGDGFDDVIVEVSPCCELGEVAGTAYIFPGGPAGLASSPSGMLALGTDYGGVGVFAVGAGDVNGDGYGDVIVSVIAFVAPDGEEEPEPDTRPSTFVHHGSAGGVASVASSVLPRAWVDYGLYSAPFAPAGDVNGDGYGDVIIGSGGASIHHGYADEDGDGVYLGGDSSTPQDCDDTDPTVGARSTGYVDEDGDGYGSDAELTGCPGDLRYADNNMDCDDARADVNPSATDLPADGLDQDCDGVDVASPGGADDATDDATDGGTDGADGGSADDGGSGKSGCSTAPSSPLPWLGALLALPALVLRRRRP